MTECYIVIAYNIGARACVRESDLSVNPRVQEVQKLYCFTNALCKWFKFALLL